MTRALNYKSDKIFSLSYLLIQFTVIAGLLLLPSIAMNIVLVALICWVMVGRVAVIQSMSLMVIIKFLNPAIFHFPLYFGVLSWLVILVAAFRILPTITFAQFKLILPLLFFSILVGVLAIFTSNQTTVSLMKNLSFTLTVTTVLTACSGFTPLEIDNLVKWFVSLFLVLIVFSIPTYFVHRIGFFRNGRGFQGILNHPQVFGSICAPACSWFFIRFLDKNEKRTYLFFACFTILLLLMFLSKSRTSVLAMGTGTLVAFLVMIVKKTILFPLSMKRLGLCLGLAGMILAGCLALPSARNSVMNFIYKGYETRIDVAFQHSRGRAIESQWRNFLRRPLVGYGFGVEASGRFRSEVRTFMGIPISAPVEKGVIFTAILEETGLLGTVALIVFLFFFIKNIVATDEYCWVAMFFSCIFINFGEAVFFSVGGIGLFYWLLMGLCFAVSLQTKEKCCEA